MWRREESYFMIRGINFLQENYPTLCGGDELINCWESIFRQQSEKGVSSVNVNAGELKCAEEKVTGSRSRGMIKIEVFNLLDT